MLKQVKADLKEHYYDRSFRGMDVDQAFEQAEVRLRSADSLGQAVGAIADVLMRLDDSHTVFLPPDRKARVRYGWHCSIVGDIPFVVAVAPGSNADKQGLRVGDRVLAWNEYQPTRKNLPQLVYVYHFVRPQASQHEVARGAVGVQKNLDIETNFETRNQYEIPDALARLSNTIESQDDWDLTADDVFVWRYAGFGDPKNVERVMKKARTAKSLILDLRGNGGGAIDTLRALVGWLFDRNIRLSVEKSRKGETAT